MTIKGKPINKVCDCEEDPVKEIRRIRDENSKRFPTLKEYFAYLDTLPSIPELLKEIEQKRAEAIIVNAKKNTKAPSKIKKRNEGKQRAKI